RSRKSRDRTGECLPPGGARCPRRDRQTFKQTQTQTIGTICVTTSRAYRKPQRPIEMRQASVLDYGNAGLKSLLPGLAGSLAFAVGWRGEQAHRRAERDALGVAARPRRPLSA